MTPLFRREIVQNDLFAVIYSKKLVIFIKIFMDVLDSMFNAISDNLKHGI